MKISFMNIAIFTNNYIPNPYGVTGSIESFRKQFEKNGHTVYVFAPKYKNYQDENQNVFRYPAVAIGYKIRFPLSIPHSKKISNIVENIDLDIIHSQHPNLLGVAALSLARKKNIPLVFTWHTMYDQYAHYIPLVPKIISANLAIKSAVKYANNVDQIIVPTRSVVKIIEKWGVKNENISIVPTGINAQDFKGANGYKIRRRLGIDPNEKVIVSISRLATEKNVIFLLNSIIKILQKNSKVRFIFGGEGFLRGELEKIVEKKNLARRVIFPGLIKKNEIKDYLAMADIFVYASKSETQGMIISEAMFMALPIVAISAIGVKDLIRNRKTGLLVDNKGDEFFQAVMLLLKNKSLRDSLSFEAKKKANEKYTDIVSAKKMLKIYKQLLNKF